MADILFQTDDYIFSYRVAGICVHDGKVLLQKPVDDDGYAFPGGHVAFGETNEQALKREFREEIGAEITVGALKWVAEIFFPWGSKPCHQLCLYYLVDIVPDAVTPISGAFIGNEWLAGKRSTIAFHWVPLDAVKHIPVYPTDAVELLDRLADGVQHFIYREE